MIANYLKKDYLTFTEQKIDWKEAIAIVAKPLLLNKIILPTYVDAMIKTVLTMGDYIIIVPKVAMPHARPEDGALGIGVSILKSTKPICFEEVSDKEVFLVICLATNDNQKHLELLQQVSLLIDEEEKVNQLIQTKTEEEFIVLAKKIIEESKEELR